MDMRTESLLRRQSFTLLADIAHFRLMTELKLLRQALEHAGKGGFDPGQPRIPAGQEGGGQWTDGNSSTSLPQDDHAYHGAPDVPIEPVYPVEEALSYLTVGQALVALRNLRLGQAAIAASDLRIQNAMKAIEDYLGGPGKVIPNKYGDTVIMREGKKVRFDIKNPGKDKPHFQIERETVHGNWKDAGSQHRYYFREE